MTAFWNQKLSKKMIQVKKFMTHQNDFLISKRLKCILNLEVVFQASQNSDEHEKNMNSKKITVPKPEKKLTV